MQKWMIFTGGIVGGVGLGIVLSALFADKYGVRCPLCNGALATDEKAIICKSCGVKLKENS